MQNFSRPLNFLSFPEVNTVTQRKWPLFSVMALLDNTTRIPIYPPSSLYPSSLQEEACLHPAECPRDDAAGRATGDPQCRQRFWMQQRPHVPGPRPLFRYSHHLRGALHQPGFPPPRHDRLQLVLRAPAKTERQSKHQERYTSACGE